MREEAPVCFDAALNRFRKLLDRLTALLLHRGRTGREHLPTAFEEVWDSLESRMHYATEGVVVSDLQAQTRQAGLQMTLGMATALLTES